MITICGYLNQGVHLNTMANVASARNRIKFAQKRYNELRVLNNGRIETVAVEERQQLIQEFFFHLVGSIDFLLQVVNQEGNLGIQEKDVRIKTVCGKLKDTDPIKSLLSEIHPVTTGKQITGDPYSEKNCYFRIMLFRNRVCHHGDNPFHFRIGGDLPSASLWIDPRDPSLGGSQKHVFEELDIFLGLVNSKCEQILQVFGK